MYQRCRNKAEDTWLSLVNTFSTVKKDSMRIRNNDWLPTYLQFRFSKKATKFDKTSKLIWLSLSKFQINWEISSNFCGLLKKTELYKETSEELKAFCVIVLATDKILEQHVGILSRYVFLPNLVKINWENYWLHSSI